VSQQAGYYICLFDTLHRTTLSQPLIPQKAMFEAWLTISLLNINMMKNRVYKINLMSGTNAFIDQHIRHNIKENMPLWEELENLWNYPFKFPIDCSWTSRLYDRAWWFSLCTNTSTVNDSSVIYKHHHNNHYNGIMDSFTNFKLLPKRHIFLDLVIRFIANRKYAFFCIL